MTPSLNDSSVLDIEQPAGDLDGELFALPTSYAQRRLWFLDQWNPGSAAYNVPDAFRLTGPLQVEVLERALNEIIRRHEIFRTTFSLLDDLPVQVIAAERPLKLIVAHLSHQPTVEEALRLAQEEASRPFDLANGPLIRATLYRLADTDHVLLITSHHIITDGWSSGVFLRELAALYAAFAAGQPSPLPELPIQYADFALWQQEWLQGDVLDEQLAYWRRQLGGSLPTLQLPIARARPTSRSDRGGVHTIELSAELATSLTSLAKREDATLFMVMLVGLAALLNRYSGQHDIVIGTPIANRNRVELEDLIGFFANTLPLRLDLSGNPTTREALRRAREVCLGAYAHQDVPFEKLVEVLQPERDPRRTPIFQVMLTLENDTGVSVTLDDVILHPLDVDTGVAKFDLTLDITQAATSLLASFNYSTDLFESEMIRRMAGHFQTLLEAMAAHPDTVLATLPLLPEAERRQLVEEWGAARASYPVDSLLHERFAAQARRAPDATALVYEDQRISYADLNNRADTLAQHLHALGVGPGVLVALCLQRSPDLIIALLATLKAGAAYVPLDPSYPRERLAFMLEDSQASVVITQSQLIGQLPDAQATILPLDSVEQAVSRLAHARSSLNVEPLAADALAYVIYTSGSTGKPKGVLVTHANVTRLFDATEAWFHFDERDVWALFHSYAFDFSVWEIWGALLYGGTLVLVPYLTSRAPADFCQLVRKQGVTVLNQTPSAFRQFMLADEQAPEELANSRLRLVIFGGEALDLQSLRPWFARHGDQTPQLVNMYGITETTVHVTYRPIRMADVEAGLGSVIGKPIPDLELYVLDEHQQPVPVGVPGELYVGGAGVAKGYLNRAELTRERFVPHPFRDEAGARLYRSGDLARYLPNGELEYLGRIDQQVKLRGFRIELGEIETVLRKHEAVREALVLLREDTPAEKRLVAYVVLRHEPAPSAGELRTYLLAFLPDYMVPAAYVTLDALPLTANGKVDRRALPAPSALRPSFQGAFVAPRTSTQELLAAIWAEVLDLEQVGIRDNFFALGGDSIRSVRVLALAKERGLHFTLQQLFRYQAIEELSVELNTAAEDALSGDTTEPFSLIAPEDRARLPEDVEDAYPLTQLQAGMVYHMEMNPESGVYHNVDSVHQRGRLDPAAFRAAVQATVARHPALRTSFDFHTYSQPLQLVHRFATAEVRIEDLRHLDHEDQEARIGAAVEEEKQRRFDLKVAPLVRFLIHRRTDSSYQFTLTDSHLILDGWSVSSMLSEIFERHFALLDGQAVPAEPAQTGSFRDFVHLEQLALRSDDHQRYWENILRDSRVMRIPRWRAPQREESYDPVRSVQVPIAPALAHSLERLARSASVPLKSVLLAAHVRVMSLVGGSSDVLTGLVANGRPEETGGERAFGLFLNTVPFRLKLAGGTWTDLIRATFDAEWDLLPYRRYPLAALQQRHGQQALFETVFNYTNFHSMTEVLLSGDMELLGENEHSASDTNFTLDVNFSINPASGQLELELNYDAVELDVEQVEVIGAYFSAVLQAMVADPLERYETAQLLSPMERHALAEWNKTTAPYPADRCVHQLFEEQVVRTPAAIALVAGDHQLTYRELDERANQLAAYLRNLGVGPEVLVGLCIERSIELVVAVLGILKAGGAYLPLDPAYPRERLAYMLADARAPVLLTQSQLRELVPASADVQVCCLDTDWSVIAQAPRTPVDSVVRPDNLAYVIYTSGSTGRPKGALLHHRGLVNLVLGQIRAFDIMPDSRVLQFASFSFDASVSEIFTALVAGAALYLAQRETLASPTDLLDLLRTQAITTVTLPPSLLAVLPHDKLSSLRTVVSAGESCSWEIALRWNVGRRFLNAYGPTEATVGPTCYVLAQHVAGVQTVPIGRPLPNYQIYILDQYLQPVPVGVPGELYVGGIGLARGYLGRPELSAERFIPDPFDTVGGARLYRTGDLARYLPDGNLEFLGRVDNQVKIRGFRIELGEVKSALAKHPAVRDVAVLVREATPGERRLVAYLVAEPETITAAEMRHFLKASLPDYMIPSSFMLLPSLPMTPNGKLDHPALPLPSSARNDHLDTLVSARDATEARLVALWEEILGVQPIGVTDNFFDLGGHSLLALRLITRVRESFGPDIPLSTLLQHPTIEGLATALREMADTQPSKASLVPLQPTGSRPPLFLVHPSGGGVLCYVELARALGSDQPVYGLQSPGWDDDRRPYTGVEVMAEAYAAAIRVVQPHGPYHLAGWSAGGVIAFEVARQLRDQGEAVALLALLDTWAPSNEEVPSEDEMRLLFARDLLGLSGTDLSESGLPAHPTNDEALRTFLATAGTDATRPPDLMLNSIRRLYEVFKTNVSATLRYRPTVYRDPLLLLRAAEGDSVSDASLGWSSVGCPDLRVVTLPGDHYTMLRPPQVGLLADILRRCLEAEYCIV